MALAEKHQMDGPSQPMSMVIMYTPKGMQASRDEIFLRGRALQLGGMISEGTNSTDAIKDVGRRLMEEGLGDVEIDHEVVGILQVQGFGTVINVPEGEIVVAYHSLIRRTADADSWTFPRRVEEQKVIPFLPHLLEITQMPMKAQLVANGESNNSEENSLRDDIARHIEEAENWREISVLEFYNSALPKTSQVRGLKSQPIVRVTSMRDPKLKWRDANDNDEVRGEEVFVSQPGGKSYVRRDTDIRVLYEGRPEQMRGMRLGQLASEYRLLKRTHKETEAIRSKIDDQTRLGPPSSSLVAGTEETLAPQAMMMANGRIMAKRNNDSKAVIHLLLHGTTSKYVNCLLWSPWQQLEDIATNQEEEETDDQKNTRLAIYPMSVFPCVEEED